MLLPTILAIIHLFNFELSCIHWNVMTMMIKSAETCFDYIFWLDISIGCVGCMCVRVWVRVFVLKVVAGLVVATFPVSTIANVAESNLWNAYQTARVTIRAIFAWAHATMCMQTVRWAWITRSIAGRIAAQIRTHFGYTFILFIALIFQPTHVRTQHNRSVFRSLFFGFFLNFWGQRNLVEIRYCVVFLRLSNDFLWNLLFFRLLLFPPFFLSLTRMTTNKSYSAHETISM